MAEALKTDGTFTSSFEASHSPLADWNGDAVGPHIKDQRIAYSYVNQLGKSTRAIEAAFARDLFAFAPIRSSPRRTYDPVSTTPQPEGTHTPMFLALLAKSSPTEWSKFRNVLRSFGVHSGLFEQIEIIRKGRKDSDPFQVGIQMGGNLVNLVDVGYGVSQVLPILVETLQRIGKDQTFLLQQPEVHLHPRAQAELGTFFAHQATRGSRFMVETHSDFLVDRVRMEVRNGTIKPGHVSLLYFERSESGAAIHPLELDAHGNIVNPPDGYRQFFLDEERKVLGF
jgi:hypothetical protein